MSIRYHVSSSLSRKAALEYPLSSRLNLHLLSASAFLRIHTRLQAQSLDFQKPSPDCVELRIDWYHQLGNYWPDIDLLAAQCGVWSRW